MDDYEKLKAPAYNLKRAKQLIRSHFPELKIKSIAFEAHGLSSGVYRVNGDMIFRLPKFKWASEQMKCEARLLPLLKKIVHAPIPDFKYVSMPSGKFKKCFVGYPALEGAPLSTKIWKRLSRPQQKNVAAQLGRFLDELHSFPAEKAKALGVYTKNLVKVAQSQWRYAKKNVMAMLNPREQARLNSLFNWYIKDPQAHRYNLKLLHADLSRDHILIDRKKGRITGILDFGDLCLSDPDSEFVWLLNDLGDKFLKELIKTIRHANHTLIVKKSHFFKISANLWLIREGQKIKDRHKIDMGLKWLKETLAKQF